MLSLYRCSGRLNVWKQLNTEISQSYCFPCHFQEVLNQPEPNILFDFDHEAAATPLDVTLEGVFCKWNSKPEKNNKVAGLDKVSVELLIHGKDLVSTELSHIFNLIRQAEDVPQDWRNGVTVTLPKKGNLDDCSIFIFAIFSARKGLCSAILNRQKEQLT